MLEPSARICPAPRHPWLPDSSGPAQARPCTTLQGRDSLASLIAVPFIQGTIKSAAEVSRRVALKQSAALPLAQVRSLWPAAAAHQACQPGCSQGTAALHVLMLARHDWVAGAPLSPRRLRSVLTHMLLSPLTPPLQGYGYWRTIEPLVAAVDQAAADAVAEVFFLDQAPPADAQAKVGVPRVHSGAMLWCSAPHVGCRAGRGRLLLAAGFG